ncbi:MAG: amino acid--tRNA ligase-related protein [Planctomycetota bacterium]
MSDAPASPNADPPANPSVDPSQEGSQGHGEKVLEDRRAKLAKLRDEFGVNPYGSRIDGLIDLAAARKRYDQAAEEADEQFKSDPEAGDHRPVVRVAGRVMQHRVMGNLIFLVLRDHTGDLQAAISKKSVGKPAFLIAKALDYGDWVAVAGPLAKTKTGETTVWADRSADLPTFPDAPEGSDQVDCGGFRFGSKSLALPPGKHHGLTDPETRYRKRYVDLYANPDVMGVMKMRLRIIQEIRDYFRGRGFEEVETPMLHAVHGGAAARPFTTHHNALDLPLYLRIAPELHLKRLLVGGMTKVFEINRNFRNEGVSPRHNPEFTMLEAYEAFGSWETMAELVEDLICTVAENTWEKEDGHTRRADPLVIHHRGHGDTEGGEGAEKTIDLRGPEENRGKPRGQRWRRVSMAVLVEEASGWKFDPAGMRPEEALRLSSENPGKDLKLEGSPAEQLVEVYEKLVEPRLVNPTYVTRVPGEIIPLARRCEDDPYFADVYELAINGVEISPGYTELNDPDVQEQHFRHQVGDEAEKQDVDEDFLEALRVGMPPAGGIGLGIDRLVMMLTGAESIRDVILFPLMRPKDGA